MSGSALASASLWLLPPSGSPLAHFLASRQHIFSEKEKLVWH